MFRTSFRLFMGIVMAFVMLAGSTQPPRVVFAEGEPPVPDAGGSTINQASLAYQVSLPLISRLRSYSGRVTFKGAAAANIQLNMYQTTNNWVTSTLLYTATTNASGYYQFPKPPPAGLGLEIGVEWKNLDEDYLRPYLAGWICEAVEGLASDKYTCDFDIQDMVLSGPAHMASVNLPSTFTWVPRAAKSDRYEVNWWDDDLGHYAWSPMLPYTGAYTLKSIPDFFILGFPYNWSTDVYGPNGYGLSYWYRWVSFNDRLSPPLTGVGSNFELLSAADGDGQTALRMNPRLIDKIESRPAAEGQKPMP